VLEFKGGSDQTEEKGMVAFLKMTGSFLTNRARLPHSDPSPIKARLLPAVFLALIVSNGCLIPLGHKTTAGHKYTPESLAFLDDPRTTRRDTLAELGPPLWESAGLRIMLYLWEDSLQWYYAPPGRLGIEPGKTTSHPQRWGLFIAYNDQEIVVAHEVRPVGDDSPEVACVRWIIRRETGQ
jgi:hypothetical protein